MLAVGEVMLSSGAVPFWGLSFDQKEKNYKDYYNICRKNLFIDLITMTSTSVKHREFVSEPMGEKEVTAVAGIGPTYGEKLSKAGFDKAYVLFGQFLLLKKEKELFVDWLKEVAGVSSNHALSAYNCLNEWSEQYI
ncbi:unnamed protein product [Brugia pahangi]|nr:unnamed protein product [Brugia pahangi]